MRFAGTSLRAGRAQGPVVVPRRVARRTDEIRVVGPEERSARLPGFAGYIVEWRAGRGLPSPGSSTPVVGGLEPDLWRQGESVLVDGDLGVVECGAVEESRVVTSFLERDDGRVLLLRRSQKVGSFRGRWAGVSGFLEDTDPKSQAEREVLEETGIGTDELTLADAGAPVYVREGSRVYAAQPFRFRVKAPTVHLDREHTEFRWVLPSEFSRFSTVPKLARAWAFVAGGTSLEPDGPSPSG